MSNIFLLNFSFGNLILCAIYTLNFLALISILFFEKKDPTITIMWIFVIFFLPLLGFLSYLFLGRGFKINIQKKLKFKKALEKKYTCIYQEKKIYGNEFCINSFNNISSNKHKDLIKMYYEISHSIYTENNSIEIFTSGEEKYKSLFKDIENAKESINLIYFIIKNDTSGNKFINLLTKKASEGVKVKLMYDEIGCFFTPNKFFNKLKKAGGEVTKFSPIKLETILHANYRNHRKVVVIDNTIGYLGGINIGDEYISLKKNVSPWRDTHLKITGSAILSLQLRFFIDWAYSTGTEDTLIDNLSPKNFPIIKNNGNVGVQIVSNGPHTNEEKIKLGILKMIYSAKKNIYVHTPYLMPDKPILQALKSAAKSGVEINFMLPGKPDKKIVYCVTYSYIQYLLEYGINVYIYEGFLHSKMVIVDEEIVTIGTTNFDIRSFSLHFEINAFIYNDKIAKQCCEDFKEDMKHCKKIDIDIYKNRSIKNKFLENIFRLFAPLM